MCQTQLKGLYPDIDVILPTPLNTDSSYWHQHGRGEKPQTWKEWCAEQKQYRVLFPSEHSCRQYMRISQYPSAYEKGMSVKEAYKNATRQASGWL